LKAAAIEQSGMRMLLENTSKRLSLSKKTDADADVILETLSGWSFPYLYTDDIITIERLFYSYNKSYGKRNNPQERKEKAEEGKDR
jgi:hypothetical protein